MTLGCGDGIRIGMTILRKVAKNENFQERKKNSFDGFKQLCTE